MSLEDRIGHLNLIAYERQEFLRKIQSIRTAFRIELDNTKKMAALRAKEMSMGVFDDMKALFKNEYSILAEQYNQVLTKRNVLELKLKETLKMN